MLVQAGDTVMCGAFESALHCSIMLGVRMLNFIKVWRQVTDIAEFGGR